MFLQANSISETLVAPFSTDRRPKKYKDEIDIGRNR